MGVPLSNQSGRNPSGHPATPAEPFSQAAPAAGAGQANSATAPTTPMPSATEFPSEAKISSLTPNTSSTPKSTSTQKGLPVWFQRLELFLSVFVRMVVGTLVTIAPWVKGWWDENPLLFGHPGVAHIAHLGMVRGLVSGLGLINLWIAMRVAAHPSEKD